jgi:hypothetical protein
MDPKEGPEYIQSGWREVPKEGAMLGNAADNQVRAAVDKAAEEMIYIGPDHPYYPLLAELVSAVGNAWQQGYEHGRRGGHHPNPYVWSTPED